MLVAHSCTSPITGTGVFPGGAFDTPVTGRLVRSAKPSFCATRPPAVKMSILLTFLRGLGRNTGTFFGSLDGHSRSNGGESSRVNPLDMNIGFGVIEVCQIR